ARPEKELGAHVNRAFLVRRNRHRRVPIPTQLFLEIRRWLNAATFVRFPVHPADYATLILGVDVIGIRRVREGKETVAVPDIFPLSVRDPAGILRFAHPA